MNWYELVDFVFKESQRKLAEKSASSNKTVEASNGT